MQLPEMGQQLLEPAKHDAVGLVVCEVERVGHRAEAGSEEDEVAVWVGCGELDQR